MDLVSVLNALESTRAEAGQPMASGRALAPTGSRVKSATSATGPAKGDRPSVCAQLAWVAGRDPDGRIQEDAFNALFRHLWCKTVCWAQAAGALRGRLAEDAAVEAWIRAWRNRHQYDPRAGPYEPWLYTIVRREALRMNRREVQRPRAEAAAHLLLPPMPGGAPDVDRGDLWWVWETLRQLGEVKPRYLEILQLIADGWGYEETAQALGVPLGTVASSISRAREFIAGGLATQNLILFPEPQGVPGHPGLKQVCRVLGGVLYRCRNGSGLLVGPRRASPPPFASAVSIGFHARLWHYPPERFRIVDHDTATYVPDESRCIRWRSVIIEVLSTADVSGPSERDAHDQQTGS